MIDFATITAFRLVRRLAMGQGTSAMYLLIHSREAQFAIEADLKAEVEVQLGIPLPIMRVSELITSDETSGLSGTPPIRFVSIDVWSPELVSLLDTHVVRLERTGTQLLFLTAPALAEQLLMEAPNFRNRLTEVLQIVPDDPSGGGQS